MISLSLPKSSELKPRIVVFGVGGAGGNAVNNMITSGLDGVEFIVANTDAQALSLHKAERRIQLGAEVTQGLGAGMCPEVGEEAAEDSLDEIMEHLDGTHMLFIAAGMGGGTGTGAAPVIARAAKERGILTVAIVTKPFMFEGTNRMAIAEDGIARLQPVVDTLITIPNQNLFRIATETTTMTDAFGMADEVLHSGVRSVTDLMVVPGIINLDFADVRTIMRNMGKAMMGTGEATGERRAIEAAEAAISNPLLDDVSLAGAQGVLINITGGKDLTLFEVEEAASLVRGQVDENANIIVGSAHDESLDGIIRVSVVATGVDSLEGEERIYPTQRYNEERKATRLEKPVGTVEEDTTEDIPTVAAATSPVQNQIDRIEASFSASETKPMPSPLSQAKAPASETPATEIPAAPKVATPPPPMPKPETLDVPTAKAEPKPAPSAAPKPAEPKPAQSVVKGPFGFFSRKKQAPAQTPTPKPAPSGDLFGHDDEEEMEIPSFLRRQNR